MPNEILFNQGGGVFTSYRFAETGQFQSPALADIDRDGWLDIFLLSGSRFGDPPEDATNRLYQNNRDGTFTDVTAKAKATWLKLWKFRVAAR